MKLNTKTLINQNKVANPHCVCMFWKKNSVERNMRRRNNKQ